MNPPNPKQIEAQVIKALSGVTLDHPLYSAVILLIETHLAQWLPLVISESRSSEQRHYDSGRLAGLTDLSTALRLLRDKANNSA